MTEEKRTLLLLTPPYHCGVVEVAGRWAPLNLLYIATAARRAGVAVELYDAMSLFVDNDAIEARVRSSCPDYVGIGSITATMPAALETARRVKRVSPETKVILGGVHPTFMPEEVFTDAEGAVDYVVCGEGEETVEELLRALQEANGFRPFGLCHSCRHLQRSGGRPKLRCGLTGEALDQRSTQRICREFQEAVAS